MRCALDATRAWAYYTYMANTTNYYQISFYSNRPAFLTDCEGLVELFGDAGQQAASEIDSGEQVAFIGEVEIRIGDPTEA